MPFEITVKDSLGKPLQQAKVTLQIDKKEHINAKVYPAPAVNPGVYIAKPVFPSAGTWDVYVEVRRLNGSVQEMSARTIEFTVAE